MMEYVHIMVQAHMYSVYMVHRYVNTYNIAYIFINWYENIYFTNLFLGNFAENTIFLKICHLDSWQKSAESPDVKE